MAATRWTTALLAVSALALSGCEAPGADVFDARGELFTAIALFGAALLLLAFALLVLVDALRRARDGNAVPSRAALWGSATAGAIAVALYLYGVTLWKSGSRYSDWDDVASTLARLASVLLVATTAMLIGLAVLFVRAVQRRRNR